MAVKQNGQEQRLDAEQIRIKDQYTSIISSLKVANDKALKYGAILLRNRNSLFDAADQVDIISDFDTHLTLLVTEVARIQDLGNMQEDGWQAVLIRQGITVDSLDNYEDAIVK